jgi:putative endonuclease
VGKGERVNTHRSGQKAEDAAALYLRCKGYQVLERNFRVPQGEIDLILSRNGTLVFVEVKGRRSRSQGTPLEAVSPRKVKRLSMAAALYLAQKTGAPGKCRFDVVTVGPEKNLLGFPKIRHFENAFSVEEYFNV